LVLGEKRDIDRDGAGASLEVEVGAKGEELNLGQRKTDLIAHQGTL
jgi:hypothetical protein